MSKDRTPLTDLGAAGIELARLLQTTDRHQEGLRVAESHPTGSDGVANAAADPQRGRGVGQHHPGFRARCFASGSATFDYRYRPRGGGRKVNPSAIKIGDASMGLVAGRAAACVSAGEVAKGKDPALERAEERRRNRATRDVKHSEEADLPGAEITSRRGEHCAETALLGNAAGGAASLMARSAGAALMALHRSGVVFHRPWQPPLQPREGLFADPHQRLPQVPDVASQRRAWRERQRARRAAKLAAERGDAAGAAAAA